MSHSMFYEKDKRCKIDNFTETAAILDAGQSGRGFQNGVAHSENAHGVSLKLP